MQLRNPEGQIIRTPGPIYEKQPITEDCKPCIRHNGLTCNAYELPKSQWRLGNCPLATHTQIRIKEAGKFKRRIGQQKQGRKK